MSGGRLDMLIAELTRPHDPMAITAEFVPERIVLAGLQMYRVMPGLPPGAEVIDAAPFFDQISDLAELPTRFASAVAFISEQFVDMPECEVDPVAIGDPIENDSDELNWWPYPHMDDEGEALPVIDRSDDCWGCDLREQALRGFGRRS